MQLIYLCLMVCSFSEPQIQVFKDKETAFKTADFLREQKPACVVRNYQIEMEPEG